jgi:hypothetical protein
MVAETKLYSALGIKPEATQDEIKKAYRYVSDGITPPPIYPPSINTPPPTP